MIQFTDACMYHYSVVVKCTMASVVLVNIGSGNSSAPARRQVIMANMSSLNKCNPVQSVFSETMLTYYHLNLKEEASVIYYIEFGGVVVKFYSSVEITLYLLADFLLQYVTLFQSRDIVKNLVSL